MTIDAEIIAIQENKIAELEKPEPVCIIHQNENYQISMKTPSGDSFDVSKYIGAELFTHPQPAPKVNKWAALLDSEIVCEYAEQPQCDADMIVFAKAIEKLIKTKNNIEVQDAIH